MTPYPNNPPARHVALTPPTPPAPQVALQDLQTNSKIAALLPYFVYVVSGVSAAHGEVLRGVVAAAVAAGGLSPG